MANPPTQSGTLKTVLGAIVIALIAGGSSPWWFDRIFPKTPPASTSDATNKGTSTQGVDTPASAPPPVSQFVMSALQYDKAYIGGDIDSKGKPAASAEDCLDLCKNDDRCRAMTYIKSQQLCWMKHSTGGGSAQTPDMISAVKQRAN